MSLIAELKRRNVIRMAGLYLVGAWLLVQVAGTLLPMFEAPAWVARSIVIVLALGFVPALVFSWVFEWTPQGWKRDEEVPRDNAFAPATNRRMDRWITVGLALALAYFGFDRLVLAPKREAALVDAATRAGAAEATAKAHATELEKSIAVLPFENRSGDAAQAYFAEGLTDELTTALARISALKVIARNSAARYKGSDKRPADIARELGVAALVAAASETNLWSESYERDEKDVLTLQSEVARAIAQAISVRLSPVETQRLTGPRTVDPRAFEEYLRGRALWNQRTEAGVREALVHLENATRIAPEFALGYAGVADSHILLGVLGFDPPRERLPLAKAAALRAIELDPGAGEPHASLGDILLHFDWDYVGAEAEHRKAFELAPAFATAFHWGSEVQSAQGDFKGALARLDRARALDPLSMIIRSTHADVLGRLGRREDAVAELRETIRLDPKFPRSRMELVLQLCALGRADAALTEAREVAAMAPEDVAVQSALGLALARAGHGDEARALLKRLDAESERRFVPAVELARIAAGLRERETTLAYLERAVAAREGFLPFIASDDEFSFLRGEPRFVAIEKSIGLSP
jgi:TolB-like protein/Flp pilus assembly protein TadD